MGFSEVVSPGSAIKTRLSQDHVELQIVGGQPQARFFIGRTVAKVMGWDHTTRVKILHGHKEDFGKLLLVQNDNGLRLGRYGKNAYAVQAGKKKYFAINDPNFKWRGDIELFSTTEEGLQVTIPEEVVAQIGEDFKERLVKGELV